jgi:cysteine-rich repeat protein
MARLGDFDGVSGLDLAVVDQLSDAILITLNTCPCGNGIIDPGEVCDGATCCSPTCTYRPAGTICRPSQGSCDPFEEVCTGTSEDCPADVVSPAGTVCAPATNVCEIDGACDGSGPVCPGPTSLLECVDDDGCCPTGFLCNANEDNDCDPICGNAVIEPGEECDGGACCNRRCAFNPAGFACRESQGACDPVEMCTGNSPDCPPDELENAGTVCNPAATPCELDAACDGVSPTCPANAPNSNAYCLHGDGCCPLDGHCNESQDNDCMPICGNGALESGENCDDGNLDECDGCTADCRSEVPCVSIPTVTHWGMTVLVIVLLAAIGVKFGSRRRVSG